MLEALRASRKKGLIDGFGRFVDVYDSTVPFAGVQLAAHRKTVALRSRAGSVEAAVMDPEFVSSLRRTLITWRLNMRGSRLSAAADFAAALRQALPRIAALEHLSIAGPLPGSTADTLWELIHSLGVTSNNAKIVAGTKTLHHLLPDLVPPMDRAWTGRFFALYDAHWQGTAQRRTFPYLFRTFAEVARAVEPGQHVTGIGWRTSQTKILDNALIGFLKAGSGDAASPHRHPAAITFRVPGLPPAKSEAKSMLSTGHPHTGRVRSLLLAADSALRAHQSFHPIDEGEIGLELVLHVPSDEQPWDATNYLGGVADVLEDKSPRGGIEHLGDLAAVRLYRNDRQIKQINYRQEPADAAAYEVTVRLLGRL
ncbi:hypothetical protein Cs7R123_08470 [Catellatospora sp. TT07R-123]|uniref:hypothetical protein n=1 Tax=Catellatospora sp. TT07R-123 TaxID=2733863 RepID=UPI001B1B23D7|nr:hypothetical protein [Catellatospora sp. TT07R-123]GHJ43505.1 hypothetical protein Cs7R123_08470 [Catellatospora sp. TT07R-123]